MALADPIFTLVVGFQLFWAAFDMLFTVVPLKVASGLEKNDFWAFQKIIMQVNVKCDIMIIYLKCQNQTFQTIMQLLMLLLSWAYQKLRKTIETPHLK